MKGLFVIGNAGLDISLAVPRLPKPGETLMGGERGMAPGGKGLNQAVVAQRMRLGPVGLMAPLGQDADAGMVEAALRKEGFSQLALPRLERSTDASLLLVMPDGENSIVSSGGCAASLSPADAVAAIEALEPGAWLLMQGNLTAECTLAAARAASAMGVRIMLNTAPLCWDMRDLLALCHVVVANEGEAAEVTGLADAHAAAWSLHRAGVAVAIVTTGASGCVVADEGGIRAFPAPVVRSVDSTGAGDTFCGVLAAMLAAGTLPDIAIDAAQRAAALTVQRPGAYLSLPTTAELCALR